MKLRTWNNLINFIYFFWSFVITWCILTYVLTVDKYMWGSVVQLSLVVVVFVVVFSAFSSHVSLEKVVFLLFFLCYFSSLVTRWQMTPRCCRAVSIRRSCKCEIYKKKKERKSSLFSAQSLELLTDGGRWCQTKNVLDSSSYILHPLDGRCSRSVFPKLIFWEPIF